MGASVSCGGSTSMQSAEMLANGSCSVTRHQVGDEYINIREGPLPAEWGNEGIAIFIIRVALDFNFHWGIAIQCLKDDKVLVINRDQGGLDIVCNQDFQQAIDISMTYLLNQDNQGQSTILNAAKKGTDALKSVAYLPHQMIHGKDSADHYYRINNGATNYEYQFLGDVSFEEMIGVLDIEYYDETAISEELLRTLTDMLIEQGDYKLLSNNCQTFAMSVAQLFSIEDQIIFNYCTEFNGKHGCYNAKPKFLSEAFTDADGKTSSNNGEVFFDSDSNYSD